MACSDNVLLFLPAIRAGLLCLAHTRTQKITTKERIKLGAGQKAQWVRLLIALAEKAGLVNSTYMKAHRDL